MQLALKACRRCGGDLVRESLDDAVLTLTCLQCGRDFRFRVVAGHEAEPILVTPRPASAEGRARELAGAGPLA